MELWKGILLMLLLAWGDLNLRWAARDKYNLISGCSLDPELSLKVLWGPENDPYHCMEFLKKDEVKKTKLSVGHTSKCLVSTALYIDIISSYQVSAGLASSDVGVSMWDAHILSKKAIPLSSIQVKHRWLDPTKHWVFAGELPSAGQALPGGASYTARSGHRHSPLTHLGESID